MASKRAVSSRISQAVGLDPTLVITILTVLMQCWRDRNPQAATESEQREALRARYAKAPRQLERETARVIFDERRSAGERPKAKECREAAPGFIRDAMAAPPADWRLF
jgi:hypothetical protein